MVRDVESAPVVSLAAAHHRVGSELLLRLLRALCKLEYPERAKKAPKSRQESPEGLRESFWSDLGWP